MDRKELLWALCVNWLIKHGVNERDDVEHFSQTDTIWEESPPFICEMIEVIYGG